MNNTIVIGLVSVNILNPIAAPTILFFLKIKYKLKYFKNKVKSKTKK